MSQEKNTQGQDSQELNSQKQNNATTDTLGNASDFLKTVIKVSGGILVAFLGIFILGVFLSQCTKKDYTNNLGSIESVTQYQQVNKMRFESSGQLATNFTAINNNNEALRNYLDKNVKDQFDNIGSSVGALNNQITVLYTLLSNSLTIISIILGMFTLIIAVLGFYISKVVEDKYDKVKQVLENVTKARDKTKKYKQQIDDALKGKGKELYESFRGNHIASIIVDLKENVENIELYHSELITNLRYLSFDDIEQCLNTYGESRKMSADTEISTRYLHILLLLDVEKCLNNERLLNFVLNHRCEIPKFSFTYLQMKKILNLFMSIIKSKNALQQRDIKALVNGLIKKDNYYKFESCLASSETEEEKNQFIKGLLNLDTDIFDGYILGCKSMYQANSEWYKNKLDDIALMEQYQRELMSKVAK